MLINILFIDSLCSYKMTYYPNKQGLLPAFSNSTNLGIKSV